jgi:MraZ protein
VFLGTHRPRLDEKGRLALPARFREELAEGVVLTKGQDRCLYGYTAAEFTRIGDALRQAPVGSAALRNYQRTFFGSASLEVPDKQGRVTVPGPLREYAGLERDCVVVGTNARFEVWSSPSFEEWEAGNDVRFAELQEEVLPGVL